MLIVKFERDWADEFSPYGLALMRETEYSSLLKWAKNANWNFGSNEGFEDEDITDGFSAKEITDAEAEVIRTNIFGTSTSVGLFPDWIDLVYDELYSEHEIVQDGGRVLCHYSENRRHCSFWFRDL